MNRKIDLYLASQSRRRKAILKEMGWYFKVVPSSYRERAVYGVSPRELVLRHAIGKALKAQVPSDEGVVLGADTVVVYRRKVLGKPENKQEAMKMLAMLQGRIHFVYTGVALFDRRRGSIKTGVSRTKVWMKKLDRCAIERYMKRVDPLDKAGSYGIQEGPKIIMRIEGSYTNVVGLPVEIVNGWLESMLGS